MDPRIAKKTQETLGKIIKKPPLTDKLLGKPPFRFLHDLMTSVIKTTGFMQGLFTEAEMNSENVKDKEAKIAFLQKAVDMVSAVTGRDVSVKPVKVVAGHEPERTNEFLQLLAEAINKNVDSDEYVRRVLKGGAPAKEEKKERDREKREERKKEPEPEVKDRLEKKEPKQEESKERGNHESERKRDKDRDRKHERDRDRHKDRDRDRHKEKDSKIRDKSKEGQEEKQREKENEKSKRREHSREKEEGESPDREKMNGETGEKHDPPARLQRPSSAKGSRRRRERRASHDPDGVNEDDDNVTQKPKEPMLGEGDLPPQVVAARQLARPSSARPAPPRPKHEVHESEPAMRLGSGQPTNVIADDDNDDDEDENFLVQETAAPPPEPDISQRKAADEADTEHGALVQKMLESKKEAEKGKQGPAKKTEIERSLVSDAQRRKQREVVQKEVDKLRTSIQNLTRNANPLGKVMDYVQEDMDSMQQELDKWRAENTQHALDLKREMNVTDRAIDPLRQQLADVDRAITDQLDQIATIKSNIIKNDQKIQKMLHGISSA